jgi:hypothetical protein
VKKTSENSRTNKKNAIEIAREYFPNISDTDLDCIIWGKTGFPCFFDGDPETVFRQQLAEYADAKKRYPGKRLCDFCNEPVIVVDGYVDSVCQIHRDVLNNS